MNILFGDIHIIELCIKFQKFKWRSKW